MGRVVAQGRGEWEQMLESLGQLYAAGAEVDWEGFDAPCRRQKVDLPTYPFQRQPYLDPKQAACYEPAGTLLGQAFEVAGGSPMQVWEVGSREQGRQPYLADHRALGNGDFSADRIPGNGDQRLPERNSRWKTSCIREPIMVTERMIEPFR